MNPEINILLLYYVVFRNKTKKYKEYFNRKKNQIRNQKMIIKQRKRVYLQVIERDRKTVRERKRDGQID